VGYQLFDAEAGTLLVDGPRFAALAPGERKQLQTSIEVPPEDGRYHIYVSDLQEGVAWGWERGDPFLLADVRLRDGQAQLLGSGVTNLRRLRLASFFRSAARACIYPFLSLWRHRSLIQSMARRDILARYRGSFGGIYWTLLHPILLMLTYFFVFGIVLQARFAGDPSRSGFALYFLAGMMPWMAFSEAVGRSPTILLENRNFIKKLIFPVVTLPVNLVAAGLVTELIALAALTVFSFIARGSLPATILWLPVLLIPQIFFTAGLTWFLSALGVFVRDLGQVIGFVLTLWFFLTPICYPVESLPPEAAAILAKNPIYALVRGYRAIFLEGQPPPFGATWKFWAVSIVVFVLGHAWFYKLRRSFADVV
jgi:lipopolysaccharide transport system permease protein